MISVTALRIKGLRSLTDTGFIELKPLTVLVGRNSTGKSTFARIFPLLRQSSEVSKKGPLLWWGRLVDFGSFDEAVSRHSEKKVVELTFKLSFTEKDLTTTARRTRGRLALLKVLHGGELTVSLRFMKSEAGAYTSGISFTIFDYSCDVAFSEDGYIESITTPTYTWKPSPLIIGYAPQDSLLPSIFFWRQITNSSGELEWEGHDPFRTDLHNAIGYYVHGNTSDSKISNIANSIPIGPTEAVFSELKKTLNQAKLQQHGSNTSYFKRLLDIHLVSRIDLLIDQVRTALDVFANDVVYLEPLRATAQRYYRLQDLSVGEIDSKGENIAMYLDSLTLFQQHAFEAWTSKHFGIAIQSKKEGGHVSLTISHANSDDATNLADMGFGFSQMLPIVTQLWAASSAEKYGHINRRTRYPLFVIEQPELHLHPEYQAKLADVFTSIIADCRKSDDVAGVGGIKIIAETHSPNLINRLGALVADKKIDRNDVQVVLFDQPDPATPTEIRVAEFDDEGVLQNWPYGFFEPALAIS
jgi:predicted ATPase